VSGVFLRVFNGPNHTLVAVCDAELLGETFREGKLKLEVKTGFYKGVQTSIPDALRAIDEADIANLVGKAIIEAAVRERLVDPSAVVHIGGVPHVQIVRM
jgi:hypothetical protein